MAIALPVFAGRYALLRQIGLGGFGVVWLAHDQHLNHQVALKLFRQPIPALAYREAQLLTALEGEHVLRVNNADTFIDTPYLDTRIAALGSAEDQLRAHPFGVPPPIAVRWVRHLLIGLKSCHDRRLIHCDIKPSNLFLNSMDLGLVGDFGVTQLMDPTTGMVAKAGTPETMAPEMIRDGRAGLVSDVYSTGVTLYRLLTGAWPFQGATAAATEALVVAGACTPLRNLAPHVSRRLSDRVSRAMAYDPAARYPDAGAFHDALGAPGLVPRSWERIAPHAGHDRCWSEEPRGRGAARHQVCVTKGTAYDIDVRRTTGAGGRLARYCGIVRDERELVRRLKEVFREL
ncbi:MAG: serine/threonine-protein kinase [Chloroflexota bacterium]